MVKSARSGRSDASVQAIAEALADIFPRMLINMTRLGGGKSSTALPLTAPQLRALYALHIEGGMMHMSSLALSLGVTQSTATDVTNRLARMGCLVKKRTPDDKRVVRVSLSAKGHKMVKQMHAEKLRQFVTICEALPKKNRQKLLKSHRLILAIYSAM